MKILKILPLLLLAFACSDPPETKLRRSNRILADSIYKEQLKLLSEEQDSLCLDREDKFLQNHLQDRSQVRKQALSD